MSAEEKMDVDEVAGKNGAVDQQGEDETSAAGIQLESRIVDLLNKAIKSTNLAVKLEHLKQVQELVIHHDIMDNFLDEISDFLADPMPEVRKLTVGFIEAACKKDGDYFPKLIPLLRDALLDPNPSVIKRSIQASTILYRTFLINLSKVKVVDDELKETWKTIELIRTMISGWLDTSENDGVRTQCIKFIEIVILCHSKRDEWTPEDTKESISLDVLASNPHIKEKLINIEQLEEGGKILFDNLIAFEATPHISSVNLMVVIQSLVILSRLRCQLSMGKAIQSFETLNGNLPPTLSKSQMVSVRKHLKFYLLSLLRHPAAACTPHYQTQIVRLLTDLGVSQSEINRIFNELRRNGIKVEVVQPTPQASTAPPREGPPVKRIKLEKDEDEDDDTDQVIAAPKIGRTETTAAIDITAQALIENLSIPTKAVELALFSLLCVPESMPPHFSAAYTPVSQAGSQGQISNLAKLLASQLTARGLGKGLDTVAKNLWEGATSGIKKQFSDEQKIEQCMKIKTIISQAIADDLKKQEVLQIQMLQKQEQPSRKQIQVQKTLASGTTLKAKQLNLAEITRELKPDMQEAMATQAIQRIIIAEDKRGYLSATQIEERIKILSMLSHAYHSRAPDLARYVRNYVFEDIKTRYEIAFSTIYMEYLEGKKKGDILYYNQTLGLYIKDLIDKVEIRDRDHFLPKFYLETPLLTEEAVDLLNLFIQRDDHYAKSVPVGIACLKSLIERKRTLRMKLLSVLLNLCVLANKPDTRTQAIKVIKYLHETYGADVKQPIEQFALKILNFLLLHEPPMDVFRQSGLTWTEENIKICLMLYLSLLPNNHKMIHDLSVIYVDLNADMKRIILRALEGPVKGMGMNSPDILKLVENCNKGAETLVTRIVHILTEKHPPSAELVARVRDLYQKRVSDVRFLIPVLNGLTKKEVIAALPKLIKLNPAVVKEVFNRLLGAHVEAGTNFQSPLTPAELLVALHNIDQTKCDVKTVMKATGLCFAEKNIYTAEVLGSVMQLLMDQNPLPTLFMRTVIQSLSMYPRLVGFVMNILQRLIMKQVWKQKKVWEGFIKCCQRTKPQSFQVLLQLPAPQLQSVFAISPDLKPALREHIQTFTEVQRTHIPPSMLDVIFSDDPPLEETNKEQQEMPQETEAKTNASNAALQENQIPMEET